MRQSLWLGLLTLFASAMLAGAPAHAQQPKPNIVFIMGDDIGWMQPRIYHRGLMVGETPNIDRIGNEGAIFMEYVAMQSCTSGRNAFVTGMYPLRTGLVEPQLPGSATYLLPGTPSIGKFLLDLGYNTGEFGKNHLGDHTASLPTAHGFQEFWGYLYHLDAMQGVSFPDINITPTNLYSGSVVVVDATTGNYKTHYKIVPKDWHDWDVSGAPALVETAAGKNVMLLAPKDGHLYAFDLSNQEMLYREPMTKVENADVEFSAAGRYIFAPARSAGPSGTGPHTIRRTIS
jgi:hypothetical protein